MFKVAFSHKLREKGVSRTLIIVFLDEKGTLHDYTTRFAEVVQGIDGVHDSMVMMALSSELKGS